MSKAATLTALERLKELEAGMNLEELDEVAKRVLGNLEEIREHPIDPEPVGEVAARCLGNLVQISESEVDLPALEEQTDKILAKLQKIVELLKRKDVAAVVASLNKLATLNKK